MDLMANQQETNITYNQQFYNHYQSIYHSGLELATEMKELLQVK